MMAGVEEEWWSEKNRMEAGEDGICIASSNAK